MIDRRDFIWGAGSLALNYSLSQSPSPDCVSIESPNAKVTDICKAGYLGELNRKRLLDDAQLGQMAEAYTKLRCMDLGDQRSLSRHECVHREACGNNLVHGSALFFLWHRWFLFFHERALGSAMGMHAPLVLPYWHQVFENNFEIADYLLTPAFARVHESGMHFPSKNAVWAFDSPTMLGSAADALTLEKLYSPVVLNWHNSIHNYLTIKCNRQGFWASDSAAGDPLFYFYHAAVDLVLEYWRYKTGTPGTNGQWTKNPALGEIGLPACFRFWDALASEYVIVRAEDALQLNYVYDRFPELRSTNRGIQTILKLQELDINLPSRGGLTVKVFDRERSIGPKPVGVLWGFGGNMDMEVTGVGAAFRLPKELRCRDDERKPNWDIVLESPRNGIWHRKQIQKIRPEQWQIQCRDEMTIL